MVHQHRIMFRSLHFNSDCSIEKGNIIQSVLEYLLDTSIVQNFSHKLPSASFVISSWPIASSLCSWVKERYNDCNVCSWSEAQSCNLSSSCLDIASNDSIACDVSFLKLIKILQCRLNPQFPLGPADFLEVALSFCLLQVHHHCVPQ